MKIANARSPSVTARPRLENRVGARLARMGENRATVPFSVTSCAVSEKRQAPAQTAERAGLSARRSAFSGTGAALRRKRQSGPSLIPVGELPHDLLLRVGFAADLDVRVNEEVKRFPFLFGRQFQVAARGEGDAVFRQVAEIVVLHLRVLVRFGDVHGDPAFALWTEFRPAVIARDLAGTVLLRDREADLELCRNLLGPGQGDEEAVEVGAVAVTALARPHRIATAPALTFLAVAHVRVHHVVYHAGAIRLVVGQFLVLDQVERFAVDGHLGVGLEEIGQPCLFLRRKRFLALYFLPLYPKRHF